MISFRSNTIASCKKPWLVVIILVIALAIALILWILVDTQSNQVQGIYEWQPVQSLDNSAYNKTFETLSQNNFNTIYLDLTGYINVINGGPSTNGQLTQSSLSTKLKSYISKAEHYGLKVQALVGNPTWSLPSNRSMNLDILKYVIKFNSSHGLKFSGIQYDDEPWSLPNFDSNYASYADDYLDTIQNILSYNGLPPSQNFAIGFTLPFSFTDMSGVKPITYNGISKFVAYHALGILNKRANTYLSFLDYRHSTLGSDGVINHAAPLLTYGDSNAPKVKVIISQEVNNVKPDKVSYYTVGSTALYRNIVTIKSDLGKYSSFGGVAVNDVSGLVKLKQ